MIFFYKILKACEINDKHTDSLSKIARSAGLSSPIFDIISGINCIFKDLFFLLRNSSFISILKKETYIKNYTS
jgi:hypothetical protein